MKVEPTQPPKVLDAIRHYCDGTGRLTEVAFSLGVDYAAFTDTVNFWVIYLQSCQPGERPDSQTLIDLVLIHQLEHQRREIVALREELRSLRQRPTVRPWQSSRAR